MKKIVVVLMSICLLFSLNCGLNTSNAEAATVKLNKTSVMVPYGTTKSIKMLNTSKKVTWSSSDKSIVTVTKTGSKTAKLKGVKSGSATVTAKVGGKKYTCKVKVKKASIDHKRIILCMESGGSVPLRYNMVFLTCPKGVDLKTDSDFVSTNWGLASMVGWNAYWIDSDKYYDYYKIEFYNTGEYDLITNRYGSKLIVNDWHSGEEYDFTIKLTNGQSFKVTAVL